MPAFLKYIEIENFKSYKGKLIIGPLKSFTAVIGPNGSGKSNFMDAISFVMGEKTSCLRVQRASELVHGASIGRSADRSASVTAVLQLQDGNEKSFMRSVQGPSFEHRIDDVVVTRKIYLNELERLGINARAQNFLVFQGAVETIAIKNPKEITCLFEEISNSGALKAEYERVKSEKLIAVEKHNFALRNKKDFAAQRRGAVMEKQQFEKHHHLKLEFEEKQIELQLFSLFHNMTDIEVLEINQRNKQQEANHMIERKKIVEKKLRAQTKEFRQLRSELQKIDQDIGEMEIQNSRTNSAFIAAKEEVAHMQKKVKCAQESLATARTADKAHKKDIRALEEELDRVKEAKNVYKETVSRHSPSQGRDVHLEDEQIQEYNRLKNEAIEQSAAFLRNRDSIIEEQKSHQDKLDDQKRKKVEAENKYNQRCQMRDEVQKRVEKLMEYIKTSETLLEDKKKVGSDLQADIDNSADEAQNIQRELNKISEQLGDAKVTQREASRNKKKSEVVENLKRLHPGVYDRLINMCQPIHERFNIAVTKVLGNNMEAIIVDTEKTARQCIKYLKEQYLEPETFLPLDYIRAEPLQGKLRDIKDPKNVKLLFDVLNFKRKDIARAVLFATKNTIVCETPEDASRVAYDMDEKTSYDCVALDGTFYRKNGIISGGSLDLAKKAKRWDEKQILELKSEEKKLREKLLETRKKSRKESELNTVNTEIGELECRLKYSQKNFQELKNDIAGFEAELQTLQDDLNGFQLLINGIEDRIAQKEQQIRTLKNNMNELEDDVFAGFCEQIGVANIREYEEGGLRSYEERAEKLMKFDDQILRIENQLDFENQRDTQSNVRRWKRAVQDAEHNLETALQTETRQSAEKDQVEKQMNKLLAIQKSKKNEVEQKEEETKNARLEVGVISRKLMALQRQLSSIESKIDRNKADRHDILLQCKIKDIVLPLLSGSIEDVTPEGSVISGTSTINTQQQYERESLITIDFSTLPDYLKDMTHEHDVQKTSEELNKVINDLESAIKEIEIPNTDVSEQLQVAEEKLFETKVEYEESRDRAQKLDRQFEMVKKERYNRFMACFEPVASVIDTIFKTITRNHSAQAFLELRNPEEPYLDGIDYNCVPPGKRCQPMSTLSGGEKAIAALALLFAVHSFQQAPFFVLDEIDAGLDNSNIRKMANYIRDQTEFLQTIVISLKDQFYWHADALIGICPRVGRECLESKVLTLDLTKYPIH